VRDVCTLYQERLDLMSREEDPLYPNWDQDATSVEQRYGEQDPAVVAVELRRAAAALAAAFDGVRGEQWRRSGRRSDGARFDMAGFSRYLLHDPVHHLYAVTGHRGPRSRRPSIGEQTGRFGLEIHSDLGDRP
jgi:hypothetical protein